MSFLLYAGAEFSPRLPVPDQFATWPTAQQGIDGIARRISNVLNFGRRLLSHKIGSLSLDPETGRFEGRQWN
jgi:hypothetical protein